MDFELLRDGLERAVPFHQHIGLEILELSEGRGVVRLPDDERLRNYTGSQQAAALFAAGEAAAVAALVGTFGERLEELHPRPDGAEITYRKIARGPITGTGVVGATAREILDDLARDGSAHVSVDVSLVNGAGDVVAELTVRRQIAQAG
jgi:acyl-coenzyme A thioesterase PaaI-like protein